MIRGLELLVSPSTPDLREEERGLEVESIAKDQ